MALVARDRAYRQVIAALYWRAGDSTMMADEWKSAGYDGSFERCSYEADGFLLAARAMEAAL